MSYLPSSSVTMFPSVKRGTTQATAREFSEENVTRITTSLMDKDSYLISFGGDENKLGAPNWLQASGAIKFLIHGYYFNIGSASSFRSFVNSDTDLKTGLTIWACIYLNSTGYIQIQGQDDNSKYMGLSIEKDLLNPVPGEVIGGLKRYFIQLMYRETTASAWKVPVASYMATEGNSVDFFVDGGYWAYDNASNNTVGSIDLNNNVIRTL